MANIDTSVLNVEDTGLLGSIRNTGIRESSDRSFNSDGSRASFGDIKSSLAAANTVGKVASLLGTATSNPSLSQTGGDISRLASFASDPVGGAVGYALNAAAPGLPAVAGMSAFNAVRNDKDVGDAVGQSLAGGVLGKLAMTAVPQIGLLNFVSSVIGGPTLQQLGRDVYNGIADRVEGIDPATSIRTVNADLDDAGWASIQRDMSVPEPTDAEMQVAPNQIDVPDDGSYEDLGWADISPAYDDTTAPTDADVGESASNDSDGNDSDGNDSDGGDSDSSGSGWGGRGYGGFSGGYGGGIGQSGGNASGMGSTQA